MTTTIDTTGKTASELRAMRDDLRYKGLLPDGTKWVGPFKFRAIVALTEALDAELAQNPEPPASPVWYRKCCEQGAVESAPPYAYAVRCPCHGYRTHGTAD